MHTVRVPAIIVVAAINGSSSQSTSVVTSANAPPRPDVRRLESLPQGDGVEVDEGDAAAAIAELLDFP